MELVDKGVKATIIFVLCDIKENMITIKEIIENLRREIEKFKKNYMENFSLKNTTPEIKIFTRWSKEQNGDDRGMYQYVLRWFNRDYLIWRKKREKI